jgi:hypothetical protein
MKWFSERKNLKEIRTEIQIESIDEALRNQLWNLLQISYWNTRSGDWIEESKFLNQLFIRIWHNYYKKPIDTIPQRWDVLYNATRTHFFRCDWNEVYDFLEVIVNYYEDDEGDARNQRFEKACNHVLETELSAYRFVKGKITEITSREEISAITEAVESPFKIVNAHLENALRLLSDRKTPDYRNSIKESISAVEAICRIITKDEKATLGKALDMLEPKVKLHGALKKAFDSLYGYTSSAEGIRHSMLEEKVGLEFEDAKFMLVSCSAFVNYLVAKVSRLGIETK